MASVKKFGTFGGVFTPSILTILGVIMYMRLPMIAGEAGLFGTLAIILIAHLISISTGLSVSSIATDKKVKEGGTYYIISRSLGLPIGGTLGLALFVGLSFSVSLYLIGFSESFLSYLNLPSDINSIRITGTIILIVVTIITFISTSLAIKTQYLIMTAIGLSLLSILFGRHDLAPSSPNLTGNGAGLPLMVLFGIFFPAVTGFEAGVSMSGDLKDPKKSIPLGTISAIAIGLVVYIGLAFFFAYTVDGDILASDQKALFRIALVPQLVIAGIWGATLSSALGSILAAPRILQSTAIDKITPRIFSRGTGAAKEPRNALMLTFIIAEAGILIGELNVIARIVSIFFIITYGFLNLSAAFESLTSADFRPSFKIPAWVSIIGFLACFLVMIQLDFLAMIGGIIILGILFLIIKRRQLMLETGDAWSSVWSSLVRSGIKRLNKSVLHTRNWRPNIILFCGHKDARPELVELAQALSGRHGMFSAFEMVETAEERLIKDKRLVSTSENKDELVIHQHKCRDIYDGMNEISRVYGFEGIEPNTILMGWSRNSKNRDKFLRNLKNFQESDFNTILFRYNSVKKFGEKRTIDVWWSGWGSNLTFSIFILRHFTSGGDWKDSHIRLLVVNNQQERTEAIYKTLQQILNLYRINVEIKIINNSIEGLPRNEIICRESRDTDLSLIGIPDKQYQHLDQTYEDVQYLAQHIGTFLLVNSSSRFEQFDLDLESRKEEEEVSKLHPVSEIPELNPSKYEVINNEIRRIDDNGQKILALFFEKTFVPVLSEMRKITDEYLTAIRSIYIHLNKLGEVDDSYRRRKNLIRIKNDFYYRMNLIFNELTQNRLNVQKDLLQDGIIWYRERLDKDISELDQTLTIPYEAEDIRIRKDDPFRLKFFTLRKRLFNPFPGKIINGKIRYSEIASYYLRDNRHYYLSAFLNKFRNAILAQFSEIRELIVSVDTDLDTLISKAKKKQELIDNIKASKRVNERKAKGLKSGIKNYEEKLKKNLTDEFRKNLQLMSNDLAKLDINYRIRRKRRNRNYYRELIRKNSEFAGLWAEQTVIHVNKIHLEVLLQAYKSRIRDKINELNLSVTRQLENRFLTELRALRSALAGFSGKPAEISQLMTGINSVAENITLPDDFENFGKDVIELAETLPENITMAEYGEEKSARDFNAEAIEVPLSTISRFYIESRFIEIIHDELEKLIKSLKGSVTAVSDLISLARFNLENISEGMMNKLKIADSVITETCKKIQAEEANILHLKESITKLIDDSLDDVFDILSVYKIPSTVKEFSSFIREDKEKKVKKTIYTYINDLKTSVSQIITKILYSRSELLLIARKITESDSRVSLNQKVLNLAESVSPGEKVMNQLPLFYRNLFSGRSSISEDFWVKREIDEELFETAIRRYNSGHHGGILIIGERNSGKTTFCRHITSRIFNKEKIFHLFPPYSGSASTEAFVKELGRITNNDENTAEIMESVPNGSIFIINDLELWCDHSMQGWEVIKLIKTLIGNYSSRFMFVANVNPYAFDLMNKMLDLQEVFISIITLTPFDSKEIRELIIRRHHSSGMKFIMGSHEEDEFSNIKLAALFNKYFNYSEGNPGTALNAWLSNIVKVSEKKIYIRPPQTPNTSILTELSDEWKVVLKEMVLQKRLSYQKVNRIFFGDESTTSAIVSSMLRAGIITEKKEQLYMVNQCIEPHLLRIFGKEELL